MLCLWQRPCLADGLMSVVVRRGLLFITDSTHRLHKAARICVLRSSFGLLVKQESSVKHVLGSIDFSGIRNMLDIKCGLVQVADLRLGGSCCKAPVPTERLSLFQAVVLLSCQSNLSGPDYKHCEMLSWCKAALLIRSCSKYLESSTLLRDWATIPGSTPRAQCQGCFGWFACLAGCQVAKA